MSLLKKYGGSSSKSSKQSHDDSSPRLESPSAPNPKPLFRKSASIDNPSGSDVDRPPSQQSGRGNKKKIIPSFISNLFGRESQKIPENPGKGQKISSSRSAGGDFIRGEVAASRESLNSVLSSSSFSYVNPKSIGGKRAKGKRIPVDDPNYGSTTATPANASSSKNSEGSKKGFGNTIERIGAKIGLKMKYNLQSCESLQYIDACDDPLPSATLAISAPSKAVAVVDVVDPVPGNSSASESVQTTASTNVAKSQGQTSSSSISNSATDVEQIDPALKFAVIKSSKIALKSHAAKYNAQKTEREEMLAIKAAKDDAQPVKIINGLDNGENNKKTPLKVESSAQTVVQTNVLQPKIVEKSFFLTPTTPVSNPTKEEGRKIEKAETVPKQEEKPVEVLPQPEKVQEVKVVAPPIVAVVESEPSKKEPDVIPTTTAAIESTIAPEPYSPPPAIPSTSKAIQSNTWGNSGRRKRKAPQPPSGNENVIKLNNGVSSSNPTKMVTDLANDVPTSSSSAAALTKFKRIEESPPPPPSMKVSSGTFEIRPRKKERSVEPMPVVRPTSSFATPTTANACNSLLSPHHSRYQQHKRSNSEGQEAPNTNTKGRVHKAGKKKAPPPPNPFGDPDAPEAQGESNNPTTVPSSDISQPAQTASASETRNKHSSQSQSASVEAQIIDKILPHPSRKGKTKITSTTSSSITSSSQPISSQNPFQEDEHAASTNSRTTSITSTSTSPPLSPRTPPFAASSTFTAFEISSGTPTSADNNSSASSHSTTSTPAVVNHVDIFPPVLEDSQEIDEETRQNMLNDEQERQQLGLLNATTVQEETIPPSTNDTTPSPTTDVTEIRNVEEATPIPSTSTASPPPPPITENDVRAAHHNLEVLSTSVKQTSAQPKATPVPDPTVKAKLIELKKEAETSPLNASKNKSRPLSIGSAIYESLMGKSSSSNAACTHAGTKSGDPDPPGVSSPKVPHKPWYKNLPPYKSRHPTQIKPFTSLVKFSELDKEATRIVEENKRKSAAEDRFIENAQDEVDEIFAGISDDETPRPDSSPINETRPKPTEVKAAISPPVKVFTTAQVHPINNAGSGQPVALAGPSNSTASPEVDTSRTSPSPSKNDGSSSPPTFQSVHAASKHRQIKPLLSSSPITNLRSEKLAIVQPQASSKKAEVKKQGESSSSTATTSPTTSTEMPTNEVGNSQSAQNASAITSTTQANPVQTTTTATSSSTIAISARTSSSENLWDCPRCTLKNPNWRSLCEACYYRKDPVSSFSSGLMSSIFQRVNAESNKVASGNSDPSAVEANRNESGRAPLANASTSTLSSIPSSSSVITTNVTATSNTPSPPESMTADTIPPNPTPQPSTSKSSTPSQAVKSSGEENDKSKVPSEKKPYIPSQSQAQPPPCENFLSQLPAKQDPSKEEKLHGIKLHEDPELEELDIGKLREARLAYFQRRQSSDSIEANSPSNLNGEEEEEAVNSNALMKTNNLGATTSAQERSFECDKTNNNTSSKRNSRSFADNEDDFIDHLLQLDTNRAHETQNEEEENDDNNIPTTIANIVDPLPRPPKHSANDPPVIEEDDLNATNSQIPQLQNRFKPRLEAIREGSSQDYTYCYSPSEIAQIYENWQANQSQVPKCDNKNLQVGPSSLSPHCGNIAAPSGTGLAFPFASQYAPHSQQTHLFGTTQHQQAMAGAPPPPQIMLQHLHEPLLHNSGSLQRASPNAMMMRGTHAIPMVPSSVLMMTVDHQPYANNRLLDSSPEENYMNTSTTTTVPAPIAVVDHPTLCAPALNLNTPTLNDSTNFSRNISPIPTLRLSPFPSVAVGQRQSVHLAVTATDNNNINNIPQVINQNQFVSQQAPIFNSYENNMSLNSSGESSRKLSYEDYRRMGAIPKGYSYHTGQMNDEWSSESSGDTDSSRGFWGMSGGYMDSLPGMSRRSTMDFSSEMTMPDQAMAVGKLMKRLEAAIAQGDHRLAATLAHDLALMKVNCVVAKINQPFSIRVYVEDRFMQQGPFLLQVSSMMTVRDLKAKIENDWGIPGGFQKWILGQKMAEDDNQSLSSFDMQKDSMAFLFLVTPNMGTVRGGQPSENGKMSNVAVGGNTVSDSMLSTSSSVKSTQNSTAAPAPIIDPVTMHAYECVDERPVYNNLDNVRGASSVSKKTSTAVQTTSSSQPLSQSRLLPNDVETSPPPPLPSRSPIPSIQAKSQAKPQNVSPVKSSAVTNAATSTKTSSSGGKEINTKVAQSSSSAASDTLSAASALTQSLQQKLAEFKAVAEQTFGKSGAPAPSSSGAKLVKEPSPGPSSKILNIRSASESPNLRRSSDSKGTKSLSKKSTKTPLTPTSSKEKLAAVSSGSTEKLSPKRIASNQDRPITPENRFNGVLLSSSDDGKPPERPEKAKKITNDNQRPTSPASSVSPGPFHSSVSDNAKKPPVPPSAHQIQSTVSPPDISKPTQAQDTPSKTLEDPTAAPQPTPRGIKRQVTSPEKGDKEVESPNVTVQSQPNPPEAVTERPTPTPRTNLKSESGAMRDSTRSPTPKQSTSQALASSAMEAPSVNEYCQTTLPFPAPKPRSHAGNEASSAMPNANVPEAGFTASVSSVSHTQNEASSKGLLLRPSAFVTQLKSENYQQNNTSSPETPTKASPSSNFLSALTKTNSSSPSTSYFSSTVTSYSQSGNSKINTSNGNPIAVAHVQPLSVSGKNTTPPTAYVAPSPSATSSSAATAPKPEVSSKKQDDSAQSYLKMLEMMEQQDLIFTVEDAECPVCFASLPKGEGIILRDCLHVFCRDCLVGCVQYADDSTVKCPFRDNNYACNNNLQEREIKALVPSEIFEKYLARSVKLAESKIVNTFHCKTPDCTGWCVFEDDVNIFLCPVCKKRNCLTCAAIHEGMDCQKYQRELAIAAETDEDAKQSRLMLEKMIQRGEALDCPACHVVLLKKWGCDWVRCSYCKTEICWVTKGFRWGKGGKGDITGGCKCGVNGVKCHPKCTYCH